MKMLFYYLVFLFFRVLKNSFINEFLILWIFIIVIVSYFLNFIVFYEWKKNCFLMYFIVFLVIEYKFL